MVDPIHGTTSLLKRAQSRSWSWHDGTANVHWVFGMHWLPALGSKGQKVIQRSLREQGFTWAVNHGEQVRLIGLQPQSVSMSANGRMASAAVAFASAHPEGAHALCLEVEALGVWLVAASGGCVLSDTDRWFDTIDDAQIFLQGLRDRHEQIAFKTSQWNPGNSEGAEDRPEFLVASAFKHGKFCRLPSSLAPWPWLLFALVAVVAVAVTIHDSQPDQAIDLALGDSPVASKPAPVRVQIHPVQSLQSLLAAWHPLPVDPAGWLLHSVNCRVEQNQALCRAGYKRREPGAHNEDLQRDGPKGWQFEPDSLDHAFFARAIDMPMQTLLPHHFVSRAFGLSQLQRLSPTVAGLSISPSNELQMPEASATAAANNPLGSGLDGARPQRLSMRHLTMRLTLRDANRLNELNLPLRWRHVDLSIVHGAQIDKLHGYLMLNLRGEWFETN